MSLIHIHFEGLVCWIQNTWLIFFFRLLNVSSHCFLDSIVSYENSHQNQLLSNCGFSVLDDPFFFCCCEGFSLSTIWFCLGVNFFQFILLGVCWTYMCRLMFSLKSNLGCFQLLSLQILMSLSLFFEALFNFFKFSLFFNTG